jgi:hypothetical protein
VKKFYNDDQAAYDEPGLCNEWITDLNEPLIIEQRCLSGAKTKGDV